MNFPDDENLPVGNINLFALKLVLKILRNVFIVQIVFINVNVLHIKGLPGGNNAYFLHKIINTAKVVMLLKCC